MTKNIITQPIDHTKYLVSQRNKLMADLEQIQHLPEHLLRRRYYEIQPELRHICKMLSSAENIKLLNQQHKKIRSAV